MALSLSGEDPSKVGGPRWGCEGVHWDPHGDPQPRVSSPAADPRQHDRRRSEQQAAQRADGTARAAAAAAPASAPRRREHHPAWGDRPVSSCAVGLTLGLKLWSWRYAVRFL
jgi:hypothetical protein